MISRRSLTLSVLINVPLVVYAVLAGYSLWATGLLRKSWWLGPVCWLAAWILARWWRPAHTTAPSHEVPIPSHWTPRDRQAAEIVRDYQLKVDQLTPEQLT